MASASYRVLKDLFENHLNFTPNPRDIEAFERDLAVVSPSLMKASLIELGKGKGRIPAKASAWREAIYPIYNRKVAEHAQLFPVFHCFETAFRSRVAVTLEEYYQHPRWWAGIAQAYRSGSDPKSVTKIGAIDPVPSDRHFAIRKMVAAMTDNSIDVMSFGDGYELLAKSTLGQTKALLESHWSLFKPHFVSGGQQLAQVAVSAKFERVRAARNSVYHHESFSGMTDAYETANELLGYINFPLPKVHGLIANTRCAPPPYF